MHHSEYMTAANGAVSYVKANAKYRGLNTVPGWIRKPAHVPQKLAARIDSLHKGAERSAAHDGGFIAEVYVDEMEKLGKDTQTGNCSELSAVAFNYLKAQGIKPLDYFGVYRGGWDHAFVVLNRDATTPLTNFAKWSEFAVLCDPLYDRAAYAGFLASWYPRALPLKSADVVLRIA